MAELEKQREHVSPGLWHFNAGTVKAKLNLLPEARFHFLQSKLKGYTNEKVEKNLQFIENQLEIVKLERPLEPMDYAIRFAMWAQNGFFTTISLLIIIGGLLVLKNVKKFYVLALTVVFASLPIALSYWTASWDKSVVLEGQPVLEGPSVIFATNTELPPGVMLISRSAGDWNEVIYPSRFRGWVRRSGLKELE